MTQSRIIALLALAVAVAAAVYWNFGRPIAVTAARVERGNAAEIVYATGAIEPVRWAKVTPLVKGRIVERCRCEGKEVKAGDVLARLDDKEAQATLTELKAREGFSKREVERQSELIARNVTTAQALRASLERAALDPGADHGADRAARELQARRADGRRRAARGRRGRRDRRFPATCCTASACRSRCRSSPR